MAAGRAAPDRQGRTALLALGSVEGVLPIEGGVPITVGGRVVGAVGVSGATSAQDAQCAQAGASAVTPYTLRCLTRRVTIIITPLANDELKGPRGAGYRRMLDVSAAGRAGTPDEVGTVGALLMGRDGAFITGSDVRMDGGGTAAY
ncbi:MAG TPA: heme-binding protein [Gemmatirosa sp.]